MGSAQSPEFCIVVVYLDGGGLGVAAGSLGHEVVHHLRRVDVHHSALKRTNKLNFSFFLETLSRFDQVSMQCLQ